MKLVRFIMRTSRGMMIFIAVTALLSGALNAGLIALVNKALHNADAAQTMLLTAFLALAGGKLLTSTVSQMLLVRFAQVTIARLRRELVRTVLGVPLRQLETIGTPRIMVALTDDVVNISNGLQGVPLVAVNAAQVLGGAVYLAWLSWKVLLLMTLLMAAGAVCYRLLARSAFSHLREARTEQDRLFGYFRSLTEGIKELKLHRKRREAFLKDQIEDVTESYVRLNVTAENRFILATNWNNLLFYAVIGILVFSVPALRAAGTEAVSGYVITTLYMMGPVAGLMGCFSYMGRASVAFDQVEQLGKSLRQTAPESYPMETHGKKPKLARVELRGVTHNYRSEKDDSHFILGPLDLDFQPGEVVFLVGGNGSGKSTLAKIVTGLYQPDKGELRWDGQLVTDANRDDYRQLFAVVFSDCFVFDSLLGLETPDVDARAQHYLHELDLQHRVKVSEGRLSTTAVSTGQRKRLALLTAYLEDRPFYVFDEWAADQDPQFKRVFYASILPDLKARGKAVLVITHDDHYFSFADRIIKLDYGKIDSEQQLDSKSFSESKVHEHARTY